jgi:curved DNA-binding protein CbpA
LALQYHPDKWSADSDHGMSKEEAEEHFKKIQNAYDHLMTKFDD